jgi:hypothetical protein
MSVSSEDWEVLSERSRAPGGPPVPPSSEPSDSDSDSNDDDNEYHVVQDNNEPLNCMESVQWEYLTLFTEQGHSLRAILAANPPRKHNRIKRAAVGHILSPREAMWLLIIVACCTIGVYLIVLMNKQQPQHRHHDTGPMDYAMGIDCWDRNGGSANPAPPPSGIACWDVNADGTCNPSEDVNGDGRCDVLDCHGPKDPTGPMGPYEPKRNGTKLVLYPPTGGKVTEKYGLYIPALPWTPNMAQRIPKSREPPPGVGSIVLRNGTRVPLADIVYGLHAMLCSRDDSETPGCL